VGLAKLDIKYHDYARADATQTAATQPAESQ